APPSPDYMPGLEEPEQAPPSPDYIPGPEHADDEIVAEDQPYAEDASPIAQSPEYVPESDFEMHPEDDDDEDPEEDHEEEHPAPADSVVVASIAADQAPSAEETEPFETDESVATPPPHPAYHTTARISIPAPVPMPAWTDSEVARLLTISSPLASPLSLWSSPPPRIPFPPLPPILSPPSPVLSSVPPPSPIQTNGTTTVTNAQLQGMIDQGVTAALAAQDALRSMNGDDSHNSRTGTKGVASLSQWCERMESFFHISNCAAKNQVKFATCTLHSVALTWWNTHVQTVGHEAAYESDKIEKYVGGLPDMIHGSVVASKPKTMQEAIEIATELMDKKIRTFAERETASKRKFENTSRNTQNQQQQHSNKRQNNGRVYTTTSGEKKQYGGSRPLCAKCNYHHDGPCALKCRNCNKIGHSARNCRSAANTNNANNQRGTGSGQKSACYECGVQGHFKRECPKLKNNNNHGNQGGRNNAPASLYVVGRTGTDPDANVVTGTFLLNNRYASVLFDTGADRSFVCTTFSTQINIMPSTLDHCYDVELADRRIIGLNTILRGCTLNLLNHPFNIDLMPVDLGSFDAIIGMDWLAKYQAVIVYAEKIVRIPWGNETLIIHGDGRNQRNATRLSIISCTKTEKYVKKGFPIFLAHITTKEVEDKLEKKRL
nr:hypothetical protein [Tanacetum cinerariifolium]